MEFSIRALTPLALLAFVGQGRIGNLCRFWPNNTFRQKAMRSFFPIGFIALLVLLAACTQGRVQSDKAKNFEQLSKLVGTVVELEGLPVGSKGEMHGLLTMYGKIETDEGWPDYVLDELTGIAQRVMVRGRLEKVAASTFHQPRERIQAPYHEGERLPERFVLRDWVIVQLVHPPRERH